MLTATIEPNAIVAQNAPYSGVVGLGETDGAGFLLGCGVELVTVVAFGDVVLCWFCEVEG